MSSINVVPVIYDRATKKVKRWALLDFEHQRNDPAFQPNDSSEGLVDIPIAIFLSFRTDPNTGIHALDQIQDYVNDNTS